jgi:hypothetical protein
MAIKLCKAHQHMSKLEKVILLESLAKNEGKKVKTLRNRNENE